MRGILGVVFRKYKDNVAYKGMLYDRTDHTHIHTHHFILNYTICSCNTKFQLECENSIWSSKMANEIRKIKLKKKLFKNHKF